MRMKQQIQRRIILMILSITLLSGGIRADNFACLKILNDSIKAGLKPVTDPNDFELVDMVGHWTGIHGILLESQSQTGNTGWSGSPSIGKVILYQAYQVHLVNRRRIRMDFY
jgi:hypothetical protein